MKKKLTFDESLRRAKIALKALDYPHILEEEMVREGPRTYWRRTERAMKAYADYRRDYPLEDDEEADT